MSREKIIYLKTVCLRLWVKKQRKIGRLEREQKEHKRSYNKYYQPKGIRHASANGIIDEKVADNKCDCNADEERRNINEFRYFALD